MISRRYCSQLKSCGKKVEYLVTGAFPFMIKTESALEVFNPSIILVILLHILFGYRLRKIAEKFREILPCKLSLV